MRRILIIGAILFSLTLTMFACEGNSLKRSRPRVFSNSLETPEEVVKVFCDMDAAGKRLSSSTWSEMLPYISWREEAMESVAVVVSGFKLSRTEKTSKKVANVDVEYSIIGKYSREELIPLKTIERVSFVVVKTDLGWKINSPETMVPHVFPSYLNAHLERVLQRVDDVNARKKIQDRIRMIRNMAEH